MNREGLSPQVVEASRSCVSLSTNPTFSVPLTLYPGRVACSQMAFWNKLFGGGDPQRVDYYNEGLELLADENLHEALTSFRLALKESAGDGVILQQIAICYTRIGMMEEAAKTYRHVLHRDASAAGAHYGLAFILLNGGDTEGAIQHFEFFLACAPEDPEASEHVAHARATLARLLGEPHDSLPEPPPPDELF